MNRFDPYRSRTDATWTVVDRGETCSPDPDAPGPLGSSEVTCFARDGFVVVRGLLTPQELADVQAAGERVSAESTGDVVVREPDGDAVRSVFAVHRDDETFRQLASHERLAGAARQLLGGPVYVHQSRINYKPGFDGRAFPWHSDFETWHVEDGMPEMRCLSASVLLTPNYPWNGPLMLIAGSHRHFVTCVGETPDEHYRTSLRKQEYGVPTDDALAWLCERGSIELFVGAPGDVVFFDCNTMHGSGPNMSPHPRSNVFFVFNRTDNMLQAPYGTTTPRPEYIGHREYTPAV